MDALAWKIAMGGRSAIVVTNLKEHCKVRNFPLELQIRCFEAPAQPSSEPQIKSCTNPSAGIFTLLASRTVFPASLRFLWFNKSSEVGIGEGKKTDLNISLVNNSIEDGAMESRNGFGCNDPSPRSQSGDMKIDENNGESFRSGAQKETTVENRSIFSHCNQFDMLESSDEHDPALVTGREAKPGNEESNVPVSVSTEEEVEPPAESENGSGEISSISESKQIKSEEADQERDTNWVVRILELRSYWKDQKKCSPISDSNAASSDQMISSTPEIEPCVSHKQVHCPSEKVVNNSCSEECEHNCMFSCRGDDFLSSVMQEDPCIKVTHDRDSFLRFLHPVSSPEVKALAQMSFLCNLAYTIPQIKPGDLWKYYRLRFVTSSLDKKLEASAKARELTAILESSSTAFTCEKEKDDSNCEDGLKLRLSVSPSVAYEIAASAASYVHSQTKYILPFQSGRDTQADDNEKPSSDTKDDEIADKNNHMSNDAKKDPVMDRRVAGPDAQHTLTGSSPQTELSGKVSAGISKSEMAAFVAASSVTAVVAAKEEAKQAAAKDLWSLHSSPCEWFICDDRSRHTRFFVIQGSESLASWQANLFFEPTQFEGYGVLVHRGIYEAAKGLYEQLLPEVLDHLRMHGDTAQLRFTGHSLGGSLSVLLSLMLLIRGAVPSASLLPVITFGSPCIMCGGDYLLQKLGLSNNHVQAIMMHRDIVPRAFACNYPNHVAEVLKRLNGRFRNHPCLNRQKLLYAPMGQLLILQPDEKISPPHPLLPSGCGLYILRYPMHSESEHESSRTAQARAAQTTFFNSPHPLETLSDPGAYGSEGSISRDHDASNYLRAINYVIRQQTKHLRRLHREQRRRMWWPLVSAEDSMPSQETSKAGINMGINMSGDMVCVLEQPMSHT